VSEFPSTLHRANHLANTVYQFVGTKTGAALSNIESGRVVLSSCRHSNPEIDSWILNAGVHLG